MPLLGALTLPAFTPFSQAPRDLWENYAKAFRKQLFDELAKPEDQQDVIIAALYAAGAISGAGELEEPELTLSCFKEDRRPASGPVSVCNSRRSHAGVRRSSRGHPFAFHFRLLRVAACPRPDRLASKHTLSPTMFRHEQARTTPSRPAPPCACP